MTYFIRRYQKGVKNSGTKDVCASPDEITISEFVKLAHETGPGKYLLGERGQGIRGFRKITDCIVSQPEELQVFAAETISVRKNLKISDMTTPELMELLGSMSRTPMASPEELTQFQADLESIHRELSRRNDTPSGRAAETLTSPAIASAGFAVGNKSMAAMGLVGGMIIGALGASWYYKNKIDDLQTTIDGFSKKLDAAAEGLQKAEQREAKREAAAEASARYDAVQQNGLGGLFLTDYNRRNGPMM
jgi:hypothetical protein|tara:strand:- start:8017 stop:8760 length:744 start_codon:yes stop_codon:yes gene_type:complete